jgi:hypothetical protein
MKITISYGAKAPARPKIGDKKMIKGVEHVRKQDVAHRNGIPIGRVVSNGKPVCSWVPVGT